MRDKNEVKFIDGRRCNPGFYSPFGDKSCCVAEHRIGEEHLIANLNQTCCMSNPENRKANVRKDRVFDFCCDGFGIARDIFE